MLFLCNIGNVAQRTFKIVEKSLSCRHDNITLSTSMSTMSPEIFTCKVPNDVLQKLQLTLWHRRDKLTACLIMKLRFRLGRVTERPLAHCTVRYKIDRIYM